MSNDVNFTTLTHGKPEEKYKGKDDSRKSR